MFEGRESVIQTARNAFLSAKDWEGAAQAIAPLTPQERIRHATVWGNPAFLGNQQNIAYFRVDDGRETTLDDMGALYRNLFRMMAVAKRQAEREHKPLQILLGETHGDRTGLAVSIMLLAIANRLGIGDLGIKATQNGFIAESGGAFIPGLKEMIGEIKSLSPGKLLSETREQSQIATIVLSEGA